MVEQVIKGMTGDRDPQRVHVREVGRGQHAGNVDLGKHDFPTWSARCSPSPNPTLQRPSLGVWKPSRVLLLEPPE